MSNEYYAIQVVRVSDNTLQTQTTFLTGKERTEFLKKIAKKIISGEVRKMELLEISEQDYRQGLQNIQAKPTIPVPESLEVKKNLDGDALRILEYGRLIHEHGADSPKVKKYRDRYFGPSLKVKN